MSSSTSISRPRRPGSSRHEAWLTATTFLAAVLLTWIVYAASSAALLGDSVVLRGAREMVEFKLAPLRRPGRPPHLVVISGSNGLYSIDSPTLSRATGMPAINAAMQWSYTYYMLEQVARSARPGDVLLLPLEFEYFSRSGEQPRLEACYLVTQDRSGVRNAVDFLRLLTQCSPYLVLDAIIAELLSRAGLAYSNPPIASILSPEGDILENAAGTNRWQRPTQSTLRWTADTRFSQPRLEALLRLARQNGAKILMSYPARPERDGNYPAISAEWIDAYKTFAERAGGRVVSEPESHMFDVKCFFDSPYHLHRGCTARNSEAYARAILDALRSDRR